MNLNPDPIDLRLKVLGCLGLVILAFAAPGWWPLTVVAAACIGLMVASGLPVSRFIKAWWSLRWLLLFTVLMHLTLSPGRMLFGSRWLSLDGLLHGLFVSAQISVAVIAALLLSLTTPVERFAAAIGWFLAPLRRLHCPVDDWQTQILMVLHFIPQVRTAFTTTPEADPGQVKSFHPGRWQRFEDRLILMLDRLIEDADRIAHRVADGDTSFIVTQEWPVFRPFSGMNGWLLFGTTILLVGYFLTV